MDVPGRGQAALDHELIDAIDLEPIELPQHVRGFHPRRPHDQFRSYKRTVGKREALPCHFVHLGAGADLDAQLVEEAMRRLRDALRQAGQDALRGLDQHDADVALGIDAIEPVRDQFARRAMEFSGKLGAGRAGADDRDVELALTHRAFLRLRAQAGVDQAAVEAPRLRRRFQRHRILRDASCPEIIGHAADRDHQRVVSQGARRRDLTPLVVEGGGEANLFSGAIEPDHLAQAIAEGVPMRLGEVVHLVFAGIDAARSHRVQ